jgi:hypothetical protein
LLALIQSPKLVIQTHSCSVKSITILIEVLIFVSRNRVGPFDEALETVLHIPVEKTCLNERFVLEHACAKTALGVACSESLGSFYQVAFLVIELYPLMLGRELTRLLITPSAHFPC